LKAGTLILATLLLSITGALRAQNLTPRAGERIFVRGGIAEVSAENRAGVDLGAMTPDSLYRYMGALDSLRGDGIRFNRAETDSIVTSLIDRTSPTGDTLDEQGMAELIERRKELTLNSATVRRFMDDADFIARYIDGGTDTLIPRMVPPDTLSKRQKRLAQRRDPNAYRHNAIFRDSIKLSPVIALSVVAPGFSQLYNGDYWKLPVLYGSVAAGIGLYAWQTSQYKPYKKLYDRLIAQRKNIEGTSEYGRYTETVTELQSNMLRHNSYRQIGMGLALASYMYFLVDGTLNYDGPATDVKKATTLAMAFPGAGQLYNGSYWKLPVVLGGTAVLTYVVNWNNRGYQRFKTAYEYRMDNDDNTVDEFEGSSTTPDIMLSYKNSYRRNRDLSMIMLGVFYIVQVVDAHATAHMKTYDVSNDLSRVSLTPSMDRFYSYRMGGPVNTFGFSLNLNF
jgi:hypothetical protein